MARVVQPWGPPSQACLVTGASSSLTGPVVLATPTDGTLEQWLVSAGQYWSQHGANQ